MFASTRAPELAVLCDLQYDLQDRHWRTQFPGSACEIVLVDDDPAGRLYVDRSGAQIRLLDIALLPSHRGQGVGRQLLADLLAEAQLTGRPVLLHVERTNPARRLYERLGFVAVELGAVYDRMEWRPTSCED